MNFIIYMSISLFFLTQGHIGLNGHSSSDKLTPVDYVSIDRLLEPKCISKKGPDIWWSDIYSLESRKFIFSDKNGRVMSEIDREKVYFTIEGSRDTRIVDLNEKLSSIGKLDLDVRFAYVSGEVLIFWRETYRSQQFKFGLLRVVGEDVEHVCDGQSNTITAE